MADSAPQDVVDVDDAVRRAKVLVAYLNRIEVEEPRGHDGLYILAKAVIDMKKRIDRLEFFTRNHNIVSKTVVADLDRKIEEQDTSLQINRRLTSKAEAEVTTLRTALEDVKNHCDHIRHAPPNDRPKCSNIVYKILDVTVAALSGDHDAKDPSQ